MKHLFLMFLVLTLALCCGACARPRAVVPGVGVAEEQLDCNPTHLQGELARVEVELNRAVEGRAHYLIRLARLAFLLGELSSKKEKNYYFEKGQRYCELLLREQPGSPEGHYWRGLNLCGLAELGGARKGLKLIPEIITEMEQILRENPAYDQAGPHRVLGRIYFECPQWPLSVGNIPRAHSHLVKAVALAPENSTNHLFLAEALFKLGKKEEARRELEQVLTASRHALCNQFLEEDRQAAQRLLQKR